MKKVSIMVPCYNEQENVVAISEAILYFISNTLMVFIMKIYGEKMALWISAGYGILFFAVATPMTSGFGILGMAGAIMIVNVVKMFVIMYLSY